MINATVLHDLKVKTDILSVVERYGHKVEKQGKGYKILCPFHQETTASLSLTPGKNLWHCFGCGASGDVVSFIQKSEGVSFAEAAKTLAEWQGVAAEVLTVALPQVAATPQATKGPSLNDSELLRKVAGYYHRVFMDVPEGKSYLQSRGITNEGLFKTHQIGYANGSLLKILPKDEAMTAQLIRLGVLTDAKKERFLHCVIFPLLNDAGEVISFYGRHIKMAEGGHFYTPGDRRGLFNGQPLKELSPESLILTESIIDALSFKEHGLENVLPLYGTNGFTDAHGALLRALTPKEVVIALDGDTMGQKAAVPLKEKLENEFLFKCRVVVFPDDQDANEYFQQHTKMDFEALMSQTGSASPAPVAIAAAVSSLPAALPELAIKTAQRRGNRLMVTVKAENPDTKALLLDTYNLYAGKEREKLREDLATLWAADRADVERLLRDFLPKAEAAAQGEGLDDGPDVQSVTMTEADEVEAMALLRSQELFKEIVRDYDMLGYIGEATNKTLAYLVMTSRNMANPLSLVIMSNSAAGKSSLQKATLELCPEEDGKHFTRLTQQSLYYLGETSLKHKCLSIEEEEGSAEASYSLKTLLSAKVLNVASTTQDPRTGQKKAEEYRTEGPVAVMVSTTRAEIDAEFESRTLVISVDETESHTRHIQERQKLARTAEGKKLSVRRDAVIKKHRNAQRLLRQGLVVVNNYAPQLVFPANRLRFRRSHEHYLDLIECIAYVRQYQKEVKTDEELQEYIEVDKEDIRMANQIFREVIGTTMDELKPTTREVLETIKKVCLRQERRVFERRQIKEEKGYSTGHLHRHLQTLENLEYIYSLTGSTGKRYVYELADWVLKEGDQAKVNSLLGLKEPDDLQEPEAGQS